MYAHRFGAKASKASSAQSRQKQLDKMDVIDAPEVHICLYVCVYVYVYSYTCNQLSKMDVTEARKINMYACMYVCLCGS
jgi:hypothetical protein